MASYLAKGAANMSRVARMLHPLTASERAAQHPDAPRVAIEDAPEGARLVLMVRNTHSTDSKGVTR